jgi:hypothetical protein
VQIQERFHKQVVVQVDFFQFEQLGESVRINCGNLVIRQINQPNVRIRFEQLRVYVRNEVVMQKNAFQMSQSTKHQWWMSRYGVVRQIDPFQVRERVEYLRFNSHDEFMIEFDFFQKKVVSIFHF